MRQRNEARQRAYDFDAPATRRSPATQGRALSLSEVARVTGNTAETICQWEDTEHLFTSQRTHTGQRRYNAETVQRLLSIGKLVGHGLPMHHIHVAMDEMAHAVARARLDAPQQPPHPLATTQKFLAVLRQVDAEIFAQLITLSHDATSTPNDTLEMIQRELAIVQPTFGAHRLLFWLRLPDGSWPADETSLSTSQQRAFARHASAAMHQGRVITRTLGHGQALTIAPVTIDAAHHSVLMIVRAAEQALDKSEQAALEYIAQRLTQFYHAARCWMNDRREWGFLRQLLDVLPQPIVMRDTEGTVVFFNESAAAIAQNADELHHAHANHLPIPPPRWDSVSANGEVLPDAEVPSLQALNTGEVIRDVPMKIKMTEAVADKQAVFWPGLATAVPLFDEAGALAYSATILQDMTMPNKIEHLKDNVLERVQHFIYNGLTATRGNAQLIERVAQQLLAQVAPEHRPKLTQMLEQSQVVIAQTRFIERWANQLRDLEKEALGKPESCSLTYLVNECISDLRPLHPTYHLGYEVEAVDTELAGQWVPADIRCIIQNLLGNAIKYSPPHSTINVFLSRERLYGNDVAKMVVRDQGQGIPTDQYENIFLKGTRLEQRDAEGTIIPGTGHGLAQCRLYTMRYNGVLYPRPNPNGSGTDFTVKLQLEP